MAQVLGCEFREDMNGAPYVFSHESNLNPSFIMSLLAEEIGLSSRQFADIQQDEQKLFLDRFRQRWPKLAAQVEGEVKA